ncbi:MAG: hypothetical protein IJT87_10565 [Ruminiclostridium sp.]|nr:hypothetical protein [Ruminiclostridium sp.]
MILGLFLDKVGWPIIPPALQILSGLVLLAGIAFMIFRHTYEKGESSIDPNTYELISKIAAWTFAIYLAVELIAAAACVCVNDACRYNYHYDIQKATCPFCNSPLFKNNHSSASDILTLGIYFDAFIVNAYVTNAIKFFRNMFESRKKSY